MHFATLIPEWNSLDSVRRAHSDLEAAALVFFALLVFFDILSHLSTDNKKKTLLEKIGLCCFAIAVLAEVVAYPYGQRNDTLSAQVIGSLDAESREASTTASNALTKSGAAETKADEAETKSGEALTRAHAAEHSLAKAESDAGRAQTEATSALTTATDASSRAAKAEASLGKAEAEAKNAENSASNALTLAQGARLEADSVKADIKAAQAELNLVKTPRSLTDIANMVSALEVFKGTKFDFSIYGDAESMHFASEISAALTRAGWKPYAGGTTGFGGATHVRIDNFPAAIPITVGSGVHLQIESKETVDALNALQPEKFPQQLKAAIALRAALASSIMPHQDGLEKEQIGLYPISGTPEALERLETILGGVLIEVGKKP